jgi:DNA-directed RNA polymerase specialized sigma subunit
MVEKIGSIITPQEAEILYLRYVEKHTFRKISEMLGNISHQGVDNKCKAIRKRVEERFQDE